MQVGAIDVVPVFDGTGHEPRTAVVAPDDAEWDCPAHPLDEHGRLQLDFGGHLIRTGGRTVLADAGIGTVSTDHWSAADYPRVCGSSDGIRR